MQTCKNTECDQKSSTTRAILVVYCFSQVKLVALNYTRFYRIVSFSLELQVGGESLGVTITRGMCGPDFNSGNAHDAYIFPFYAMGKKLFNAMIGHLLQWHGKLIIHCPPLTNIFPFRMVLVWKHLSPMTFALRSKKNGNISPQQWNDSSTNPQTSSGTIYYQQLSFLHREKKPLT